MAIQTRYVGDSLGINNVDSATAQVGTGAIIATGLTKNPIAVRVVAGAGQSFTAGDMSTGGSVETILRAIGQDSTITMYQVDTAAISVLLEATGAGTSTAAAAVQTPAGVATALQTRIQALTANIGNSTGNIWANVATVTGTNGFKLS